MSHQLYILCFLIAAGSGNLHVDDPDREYFDDNLSKRGKDISLDDYDDDDLEFRDLDPHPENYLTERELDYDVDDDDNDLTERGLDYDDDDDNDLYLRGMEKDQDQDPDSFPTQKRKYRRRSTSRGTAEAKSR